MMVNDTITPEQKSVLRALIRSLAFPLTFPNSHAHLYRYTVPMYIHCSLSFGVQIEKANGVKDGWNYASNYHAPVWYHSSELAPKFQNCMQ